MFDETSILKSTALLPYHNAEPLSGNPSVSFPTRSTLESAETVHYRSTEPLSGKPLAFLPHRSSGLHYYKIECVRRSEYAWLIFAQCMITKESFVVKKLCQNKDIRYSLGTIIERQECQLEALRWNRTFSPEIYIGLVRIYDLDIKREIIGIDQIFENPTKDMLDKSAEYGLLMHKLPEDWRLDYLLVSERSYDYVELLIKRVAQMHENLPALSNPEENGIQWGSYKQIREKLEHNFTFADLVLTISKTDEHSYYSQWKSSLESQNDVLLQTLTQNQLHRYIEPPIYKFYNSLKSTLNLLKETLLKIIAQNQYQCYFEQRIQEERIKRCHGDLKASNIWITPYTHWNFKEPWKYVWILDAIDFNSNYSNIDILSDFAMLVIDICARTKNPSLANHMVKNYLQLTHQEDEVSKSVLAYYLVEKAIVGAIVSIIYDNLPDLGLSFLESTKLYMEDLTCRAQTQLLPTVSLPSAISWLL